MQKRNWLPNLFMLLASLFFIGIIFTVIQKEILPHFRKEAPENFHTEMAVFTPNVLQVYKLSPLPKVETTSGDDNPYYFDIIGTQDSLVYFKTETAASYNPPGRISFATSMELPTPALQQTLQLRLCRQTQVLYRFPPFTAADLLKKKNEEAIPNNSAFYPLHSTDGRVFLYLLY